LLVEIQVDQASLPAVFLFWLLPWPPLISSSSSGFGGSACFGFGCFMGLQAGCGLFRKQI
jgi:hypothetical protein